MSEVTYLEAIREALFEEMERDVNVMCLGEDIGAYGGGVKATEGMLQQFRAERVLDTPISEIAIVGAAAGAAHIGMRPVVEMQFIDFFANAQDMLRNQRATARERVRDAHELVVQGALSRLSADAEGRAGSERWIRARRTVPLAEPGGGLHP